MLPAVNQGTHAGVGFSSVRKHPQFILAMDASYFNPFSIDGISVENFRDGVSYYPADLWLMEAQSYLVIREREWLDERKTAEVTHGSYNRPAYKGDRKYRQLLPYAVIRQMQDNGEYLYFPYRRTKKVGESLLAGAVSFGYGGHIDLVDVCFRKDSVINLAETINLSAAREIFDEETQFFNEKGQPDALHSSQLKYSNQFIADNSTEVNCVHLGIIMTLDLPAGWTMKTKEDELVTMPPMTAKQMLEIGGMESWTELLVREAIDNAAPLIHESEHILTK